MKFKALTVFLALITASCSYLGQYVPQVTLQTSPDNVISGRNLIITNSTGYYGELEINCRVIGVVNPGDTFFANWNYDWNDSQSAVTLTFWKTADKKGFVGAAGRQFYNTIGRNNWVVKTPDIITPDGRTPSYRQIKNAGGQSFSFSFPRIIWHPTTVIQIVNDTKYKGTVVLNGSRRAVFETGDVYCANLENNSIFIDQYTPINITLLFDLGGKIGTYQNTAYTYSNQEYAFQAVVSAPQISY